jgi:hypothetical protein
MGGNTILNYGIVVIVREKDMGWGNKEILSWEKEIGTDF